MPSELTENGVKPVTTRTHTYYTQRMKFHDHLHTHQQKHPTHGHSAQKKTMTNSQEQLAQWKLLIWRFIRYLYLFWPFSPKYTFEFKFETWDSIFFVHVGSGVPMHVLNIPVPKLGLLYCLVFAKNVAITSLRPCFSRCQVILNHPLLILARQLNIPFPRFFYMKKQPWERRHWASWWLQLMMAFSNMED
jgi:hypothetical protein